MIKMTGEDTFRIASFGLIEDPHAPTSILSDTFDLAGLRAFMQPTSPLDAEIWRSAIAAHQRDRRPERSANHISAGESVTLTAYELGRTQRSERR